MYACFRRAPFREMDIYLYVVQRGMTNYSDVSRCCSMATLWTISGVQPLHMQQEGGLQHPIRSLYRGYA